MLAEDQQGGVDVLVLAEVQLGDTVGLVLVGIRGLLYLRVTAAGQVGQDVGVHVRSQDLVLPGQYGHGLL